MICSFSICRWLACPPVLPLRLKFLKVSLRPVLEPMLIQSEVRVFTSLSTTANQMAAFESSRNEGVTFTFENVKCVRASPGVV